MKNVQEMSYFLRAGENCKDIIPSDKVKVLIDVDSYFKAFYEAIQQARETVYIFGWDIDHRLELIKENTAQCKAPIFLGSLFKYLIEENPNLRIYIICWDYSVFFALERDLFPYYRLQEKTPEQIQFRLDNNIPLWGSHHQKCVVIDDSLCFIGGVDLCRKRWDTPEHKIHDQRRKDFLKKSYGPFHDVHAMVKGSLAQQIGDEFRHRWELIDESLPKYPENHYDHWPTSFHPDFENLKLTALSRNKCGHGGEEDTREVYNLFVDSFQKAQDFIYIETQYLSADNVIEKLKEILRVGQVEVIIVTSNKWSGVFEKAILGSKQNKVLRDLHNSDIHNKLRVLAPWISENNKEEMIKIHSKVCIVDGIYLRVGSANLNNRSMIVDTEYDYSIESGDDKKVRDGIFSILYKFLSEHLGMASVEIEREIKAHGSLIKLIDKRMSHKSRNLRSIQKFVPEWMEGKLPLVKFVDPDRPYLRSNRSPREREVLKAKTTLIVILLFVIGATIIWKVSLDTDVSIKGFALQFESIRESKHAFWVIIAFFTLGSLIVFPLNLMLLITTIMFPPHMAIWYCSAGVIISSTVGYLIGEVIGKKPLEKVSSEKINELNKKISKSGLLATLFFRLVPLAPYSFINLFVGASRVRYIDFLFGTIIGTAPGILAYSLLGNQIQNIFENPSATNIVILIAIIVALTFTALLFKKKILNF